MQKELEYGNFSKEPIIENFLLQGDGFTIDLWGKENSMIHFYTDRKWSPGFKKFDFDAALFGFNR